VTNILIVRSAPIQQLDASISKITQKFDSPDISILSHEHAIELLNKYECVNKCITYPFKESFDISRKAKFDTGERFDHAIIMVGNLSGCGFQNVLFFALSLPARKIWICNLIGELTPLSRAGIILKSFRNQLFKFAGFLSATIFCLFAFPLLFIFLNRKSSSSV
jgi:hypothetical protein